MRSKEARPQYVLISFNKLRSFLCKHIWKTGCTTHPTFTELIWAILTVKLDSPSEKPVKNQGFRLSDELDIWFEDREVYDLFNVIKWLERILTG